MLAPLVSSRLIRTRLFCVIDTLKLRAHHRLYPKIIDGERTEKGMWRRKLALGELTSTYVSNTGRAEPERNGKQKSREAES